MTTIYTRILNQNKNNISHFFSANFYKISEEDQRSDEIELFINLKFNQNLTETDIDNIDVKFQLEHQVQNQEIKESGSIFDKKNISKKIRFQKTIDLDGSSNVKTTFRSNALLKIEKQWSLLFLVVNIRLFSSLWKQTSIKSNKQ